MIKLFDKKNNRLLFFNDKADPFYWDYHWNTENYKKCVISGIKNKLIINSTRKYLPENKLLKILDGGCGRGQFVYAFDELGYVSYGVDFAKQTVRKTKKLFPKLNIYISDVRKLDFSDNFFDGYWSLGVIEHFYNGYEEIIQEAFRILKPGGYFFITFPHMSRLRKIKAKLSLYNAYNEKISIENFYQFALDDTDVIKNIEKSGFTFQEKKTTGGLKGLKDEVNFLEKPLQKLYDSKNILARITKVILSEILDPFSSHSILIIFKRNNK